MTSLTYSMIGIGGIIVSNMVAAYVQCLADVATDSYRDEQSVVGGVYSFHSGLG